jgi:MFS family permease
MTAASLWSPLRVPTFRGLWVSGAVYFLGNAMHTMACSWLMLEVTESSFLAALVQTAVFFPMFLLSLPAGVLADIADRGRLMQISLSVYTVTAAILAVLSLAGMAGPVTLLGFTFIMGCCTALQSPAWNSSVSDSVTREELPQAITMVSMAFNGARAVGPALAGVVFAVAGSGAVFCIAVFTALTMMVSLRRYPPQRYAPGKLPAERLWGGMLSGLRFFRHSRTIFAQLVRTVAFSGAGSALWALLPAVEQQHGLGAAGYGLLMGCLGGGAVAVGFFVGKLRAKWRLDWLVGGCCVMYGLVMVVAGLSPSRHAVYAALVLGGASWMATMSTLNAATQTSAPLWVRARAASMHTLCSLGSFALGSAVWGALSDIAGLPATLCTAGAGMMGSALLARPFPLRIGAAKEINYASPRDELHIAEPPHAEAGPVAVEVAYRINTEDTDRFLDAAERLRQVRRRAGATFWRVYRDLGDPSRYVERFIVRSWADYLRQRERATVADQELESRVRAFQTHGTSVETYHYIAER